MSRFKQKFAELFDKSKKTTDADLTKRLQIMHEFESEVSGYLKNVQNFNQTCFEMIRNQKEFGDVIWTIYEHSAMKFYIKDVRTILQDTSRLQSRLEGTASQLTNLCQTTLEKCAQLRKLEKDKEDKRVFYDYYRRKIPELEKKTAAAQGPSGEAEKKQEKLKGNKDKQSEANKAFLKASQELDSHLLQLEGRTDMVLEQLCIKFSRDIESQFYTEINQIMQRLCDVEEKMREVATDATTGKFGHLTNNLDLNVNF
ncbi:hypothetical protein FGO68_gene6777 [Halteria grandinella]|uniref:BAR domain-containing protein n=1 Tax=Halteria grandinella TaxID=5974 RepID=A0A8J8SZC2_HALGN|nr:hypothetical protein FGO68_gene6777 [Halteria grandinella]